MKKAVTLSWLLFFFSSIGFCQNHPFLKSFSVNKVENHVLLSWIMASGNTCDGTFIERSADGLNFTEIGDIPGICGSDDSDVPFQFIDYSPLINQKSFYRLRLGTYGYSQEIEFEFIDIDEKGFLLKPNPVKDNATFYFENPQNKSFAFRVISIDGQQVFYQETNGEVFYLNFSTTKMGVYFFELVNQEKQELVVGKLVVQ